MDVRDDLVQPLLYKFLDTSGLLDKIEVLFVLTAPYRDQLVCSVLLSLEEDGWLMALGSVVILLITKYNSD